MAVARFQCRGSVSSAPDAERPGAGVLWRLLGANNRELGRATIHAAQEQTCCEAVARLKEEVGRATSRVKVVGATGSWIWSLELEGTIVAASCRSYLRQRECQYSLAQFLAAVSAAGSTDEHCRIASGTR
jgi:hypothetical protein